MLFEVEIIKHNEYVEAIISGNFDLQKATDNFPSVLGICKIADTSKVLIDFRKMNGDIYAVQKIIYSLHIIDHVITYFASKGKCLKFAYVGKVPLVSTYEPGLEIAKREGIQAIVTIDINEAVEWLGVSKT